MTRLYLISPLIRAVDEIEPLLQAACGTNDVAAVLLRMAGAAERDLIERVKTLAPPLQDRGIAVLIELEAGQANDPAAIAMRGGGDGVHASFDPSRLDDLRASLKGGRMLGAGNLRLKDEAMRAGEIGVDYVMFGEPRPDGYVPDFEGTLERATWWAEIFETPCVVYAPDLAAISRCHATGAEFIALQDAVWRHEPGPAAAIRAALAAMDAA